MLKNLEEYLTQLRTDKVKECLKLIFSTHDNQIINEFHLFVSQILNRYDSIQQSYILLNGLLEIEEFEWTYFFLKDRIFKQGKNAKVEIEFYLAITNILGKRKEFQNFFFESIQNLIVEKNYGLFHKIYEAYQKDIIKDETLIAAELFVAIEEKNIQVVENIYKHVREKILACQISIDSIQQLYLILEQFNDDEVKVYQYKIFLKSILHLYNKDLCSPLQMIDYVFLTQDIVDLLIIHTICPSHTAKEMLALYLEEKISIANVDDYKLYKRLSFFSKQNKRIKMTMNTQSPIAHTAEKIENKEVSQLDDLVMFQPPTTYKITEEEQALRTHKIQQVSIDLIISMISSEYYTLALELLDKVEQNLNYFYLKAEILYRKNEYSNVVMLANHTIEDFKINGEERFPFELLKAKAFFALGELENSKRCLDLARQLDGQTKLFFELD